LEEQILLFGYLTTKGYQKGLRFLNCWLLVIYSFQPLGQPGLRFQRFQSFSLKIGEA